MAVQIKQGAGNPAIVLVTGILSILPAFRLGFVILVSRKLQFWVGISVTPRLGDRDQDCWGRQEQRGDEDVQGRRYRGGGGPNDVTSTESWPEPVKKLAGRGRNIGVIYAPGPAYAGWTMKKNKFTRREQVHPNYRAIHLAELEEKRRREGLLAA